MEGRRGGVREEGRERKKERENTRAEEQREKGRKTEDLWGQPAKQSLDRQTQSIHTELNKGTKSQNNM